MTLNQSAKKNRGEDRGFFSFSDANTSHNQNVITPEPATLPRAQPNLLNPLRRQLHQPLPHAWTA